jgi:transposase-like protein
VSPAESFRPVAGRDYPRDFNELVDWFSEEERCYAFLEGVRWREGFRCPHCGAQESYWRASRGRRRCTACRKDTSVTAGTILDKTRLPLRTWFFAAWYVVNQKNGVSALGLQRVLGFGSYKTAWTWLHKLRRAMVRPHPFERVKAA